MASGDREERAGRLWDGAVVVALGSNLGGERGSSAALLEGALGRFSDVGLKLLKRSSWWRSRAWPDPTQPDYLNGVALVETALGPEAVLAALHRLESEFGRERSARNAARTLDLDLIAHGRRIIDAPAFHLPHQRAAERLFVMGPLAEIAPGWLHPVLGRTAADLATGATVGADATPLI